MKFVEVTDEYDQILVVNLSHIATIKKDMVVFLDDSYIKIGDEEYNKLIHRLDCGWMLIK